MKILDKYIIKKFLGTFAFALILILAITIVFDVSEKIDNFLEENAPLNAIIFDYYLNFIPYFANLFSSLFVFITVIFFTSKMASNTEIIAILSNGVSFSRMMRPYLISAFIIALTSFFLGAYIIPPANETRIDFDNKYLRGYYTNQDRNIHKQIRPGVYVYMRSFNSDNDMAFKFSMEKFENDKLKSKLISNYARYDTSINKWSVRNYYIREINGVEETIKKGYRLDTAINLSPSDLETRADVVETMDLTELNKFIEKTRMQGSERVVSYIFDMHSRFAYPFSIIVLTIMGVALSARKSRGGIGLHIGLGILLSFTYILFMRFSKMFAISGAAPPILAVWIPNILYGIITVFLYRSAPK